MNDQTVRQSALGWPEAVARRSPQAALGWIEESGSSTAGEPTPPPTPREADEHDEHDRNVPVAPVTTDALPEAEPSATDQLEDHDAQVSETTVPLDDTHQTTERSAAPAPSQTGATAPAGDAGGAVSAEPSPADPVDEVARRRAEMALRLRGFAPKEPYRRPAQTRVMTVANQKGGVGKTTTAVNLAAALALGGLRVVVIDTDPQGNASTALGIEHHAEVPSVYDVLVNDMTIAEVLQDCPDLERLQCVPATIELAGAEIELVSFVARETRLQRAITAFIQERQATGDAPDYILIDCPPSLGLLTINAFVAGQEVLIPIQCEYYALEGLSMLLRNIEMIRRHLNPALHVSTILLTMYDARTRLSAQVADEVRGHFPGQVLKAAVPRSVRISEAPSHGQTVLTYDPLSSGALSYRDAAQELAARG